MKVDGKDENSQEPVLLVVSDPHAAVVRRNLEPVYTLPWTPQLGRCLCCNQPITPNTFCFGDD